MKLCWNVYKENINKNNIDIFNIFECLKFKEEIEKAFNDLWNENDVDKFIDTFKNKVNNICAYYFKHRNEYEIVLCSYSSKDKCNLKIDIYNQIMLNYNSFIYYLVSYFTNC